MEERNEERTTKASKKEFQFGLWRRGWGGQAKAHQRADLEQKCIVTLSNLSLYTISFYLLVMSLVLKDKSWMWTVSLKCSQGQLEEAPAEPQLPLTPRGLWTEGNNFGQSPARIPRSFMALTCCSDRPAAWPISVFIRDFMAFYAPFISWLELPKMLWHSQT